MRRDKGLRLTRRRFLAVASAAAAAGTAGRASAADRNTFDVAIVGAGLAGLNAALILSELGARVVVLEANQRAGGRCLTRDDWYLRPDLGGAQIGRDYARVLDSARRFNVELGPGAHVNAPYAFVVGGKIVTPAQWPRSPLNRLVGPEREVPPHALAAWYVERLTPFKAADDWLRPAARPYDVSLADWLSRQGASPEARRIIGESQGVPPERLALLRMLQEATRSRLAFERMQAEQESGRDVYERMAMSAFHVVGGTSRLVEAMAGALGDRVRLGQPVVAVDMDASGCTVRCADGNRVRARYALAAVPFTVLREIAVTPALAGAQAEAVNAMPYGNQSQVWLRVKSRYWEADGIEASMWTDGTFTLIRQQLEHDGARELVSMLAFSSKSRRLDAMPLAERGRFAIAELARIRPSTRGRVEFVGAHSWESAPYSRGCSYQFVPGRALDWQQAMAKPHDRLHFAGEHLRQVEVGMEAAMESGERAAGEIAGRLAG